MWSKIVREWGWIDDALRFWLWWGCMPYFIQWFTVELMRG